MSYLARLPERRPAGLRLVPRTRPWYRIDPQPPYRWSWKAAPAPRSRFDPASGRFRVRYAGDSLRVAMRERFDRDRRIVSRDHLGLHVVELRGKIHVLDLRSDKLLDLLGLDDQVSTSRAPDVWAGCQELTDRLLDWFGTRIDGVAYRSRTTPQRSANLAFLPHAPLEPVSLGRLGEQTELLAACIAGDGFAVEGF